MVLFEVLGQHNPALREGTLLCVRFQRVEDQEIAAMLARLRLRPTMHV